MVGSIRGGVPFIAGMDLAKGASRSGFDTLMSLVTGMRGPLGSPGSGKWYARLYAAYVAYIEFALFVNWLTILVRFLTPGVSVEERCFTGFPTGTMSLAIVRRIDMYIKKPRYKKLMEEYLSLYGNSPELNADVKRSGKIILYIPRILFLFTAMPMATIDIMPAIVALSGGVRALCVPAVYPFDPAKYLYLFCYLCSFQSTAAFSSTLRSLQFENTFNMFACRQLALTRHLSRELVRILSKVRVTDAGVASFISDDGRRLSKEQAGEMVAAELKQWVKNHQRSIRMAKELQEIYSISIFLQYAFTGVILCTNAFVVANNVGGEVRVFFCGLYVFGLLVELLITCRLGDLILYESNSLERVLEGTHVYPLPSVIYKIWVRIILTRAKVPMRLSALGVFPLNIETYKQFILTTYSFFTLLKTMKH